MVIERGSSNTLAVMARETLSPSYWLLHFNDPEPNGNAYCVVQAGNATSAMVTLTFTEVASGAVAADGEVTLSPAGNWNVTVYEQTSPTNIDTDLADRLVREMSVFVEQGAAADSGWTEQCPDTGGGGGTVTITSTDGETQLPPVNCGETYALPQTHIFHQDNTGSPTGAILDLDTMVEEGDGHLYPDIVVPSRALKNTLGNTVTTFRVTLEDLIDDTVLACPDAIITFDGVTIGTAPSGATTNFDCGTVIDAAYVEDGGSVTGTYFVTGTLNEREVYEKDDHHRLEYTGTRWRLVKPGSDVDAALGSETYPWEADWSATSVTVQESTIGNYCGGAEVPCGDLTITINGDAATTVANPCGATADIDVVNTADTPVGTWDTPSTSFVVPDARIEVNSISLTEIASGVTGLLFVKNSDDTEVGGDPVGTTWYVGDSIITRTDGSTVGLPATEALDVRSYRTGIAYNFGYILASGQTASYRTGDEGSIRSAGFFDYTRPVYPASYAELSSGTWDTLAANNIHGNTLRFTDRSGSAAATSGNRVIQDHLTGLEWYVPSSLPAATTWNAAIDAAEASTVESSTDWILPSDRMLDTISRDDQANPLNVAPLNLGTTLEFWTSTTDPLDTTQARRCVNSAGGGLFGRAAKSGNNGSYVFCRKFLS